MIQAFRLVVITMLVVPYLGYAYRCGSRGMRRRSLRMVNTATSFSLETASDGALELHTEGLSPFRVDFLASTSKRRHLEARTELVHRAVGSCDVVVDFTAGLGRDSLVLAAAGHHVLLVERSPILHQLLQDGLRRLRESESAGIARRVRLIDCCDAAHNTPYVASELNEWLPDVASNPNRRVAVYLDPMYPTDPAARKAKSKKDTQILHLLAAQPLPSASSSSNPVSIEEEELSLFAAALQLATSRIVVKRGLHDRPLFTVPSLQNGSLPPLKAPASIKSSTQRMDIYSCSSTVSRAVS